MAKDMTLRGVGGWLYFLIIVLTLIGPLAALGRLAREIATSETQMPGLASVPAWGDYKLALWLITFAAAIMNFVAGYRLARFHVSGSVRFAIISLWCAGPGTTIPVVIAAALIFGPATVTEMARELSIGTFQGAIGAAVWTTYLRVSVRVRNTYSGAHLPVESLTAGP